MGSENRRGPRPYGLAKRRSKRPQIMSLIRPSHPFPGISSGRIPLHDPESFIKVDPSAIPRKLVSTWTLEHQIHAAALDATMQFGAVTNQHTNERGGEGLVLPLFSRRFFYPSVIA